jgi:hydroxyacylglutathione hydrolase
MDTIITIKAFNDNLIYLYQYSRNKAIVIDPGDSTPVLKALDKYNLSLTAILATHHHMDHVGGAAELKKKTGCQIISGDNKRIAHVDYVVENGQILRFDNVKVEVIDTPGHTNTSVCYYIQQNEANESGNLFTGDTLFIGGCGRLFECDAVTMWNSLQKLAALPDETKIYCGHDYTLDNYEFALEIEPDNPLILKQITDMTQAIRQNKTTVPSTIAVEKATNPFLRADTDQIKAALRMPQADAVEIFAELRRRKDVF